MANDSTGRKVAQGLLVSQGFETAPGGSKQLQQVYLQTCCASDQHAAM